MKQNIKKMILITVCLHMHASLSAMQKTISTQSLSRELVDKWSPLHIAASKNAVAEMDKLLKSGIKKDVEDAKGRTPLFIAAELGKNDSVRFLCIQKADLNAKEDEHGMTPLHVASWNGQDEIVEILLENGARIDEEEKLGKTPLHIARSKEVVRVLLSYKASVNQKDRRGFTPLESASQNGNREVFKTLLSEVKELRGVSDDGSTLLHRVAQAGATADIIKITQAFGSTIWDKDKNAMIPLHRATFAGKIDAAESLIAIDVKQLKACDKEGETPLHWASFSGHSSVVNLLILKGAVVDARNKKLMTPLHWAATKGHEAVAMLLVETHKADVNAKASLGETPLHRAASIGSLELVKLLLINGARPQEKDNNGLTPAALAEKIGHQAVKNLLQNSPGKIDARMPPLLPEKITRPLTHEVNMPKGKIQSNLELESSKKNVAIPQRPQQKNVRPVRVLKREASNKLHKAIRDSYKMDGIINPSNICSTMDLKKIDKGLENARKKKGFSIDALDEIGESALMLAAGASYYHNGFITTYASLELLKKLLDAGADPNVTNSKGITPLICLVANSNAKRIFPTHSTEDKHYEYARSHDKNLVNLSLDLETEEIEQLAPFCYELLKREGNPYIRFVDTGFCWDIYVRETEKQGLIMKDKNLYYQLMREMITKGCSVNHADSQGITVLMWACAYNGGDGEVIKILLNEGADIAALNKNGENALMLAARWGTEDAVRLLVLATPNVNHKSKAGETALTLAGRNKRFKPEIFKILLEAGADCQNILPSMYLKFSPDAKFLLDDALKKTHPVPTHTGHGAPTVPNSGDRYARYQTEAYQQQQQDNFERMDAGRAAQLSAQESANTVRAVGTGVSAVTSIVRLAGGM